MKSRSVSKTVHVVNVDNYFPEMCELTFPLLRGYAKKIGAQFNLITERKYPEFPPTYEKLQIYEQGADSDWNILIDADVVVGPDAPDVTTLPQASPAVVLAASAFPADGFFQADPYFLRDGRKIGLSGYFLVTHKMCHDLWTPLEFGYDVARHMTKRQHIVDEYCLSRNLAKFGLKMNGIGNFEHFVHIGTNADGVYGLPDDDPVEEKIERTKRTIDLLWTS